MKDRIYINDTMFSHAASSACERVPKYIEWVLNTPEHDDDATIIYTDCSLNLARKNSKKNIGWLLESPEYHAQYYEWIKFNHDKFCHVITHDKDLLELDKKFKFIPISSAWISDNDIAIHNKSKNFSMISSMKNETSGHKMRHRIIAGLNGKVDLYGREFNPIINKITGLKDYRYTFCVENCKKDYYFTEKLIDCFLTGTIPIYWGCPSIGNFFDVNGMIIFDNLLELKDKLKLCTEEYYLNNMESISKNFKLAQNYLCAEDYIYQNKRELFYAK